MKKNLPTSFTTINSHKFSKFVIAFLLFFIQTYIDAFATATYITFNDGIVYVFPDSCVANISNTEDSISFTAIDGNVYSYPSSQVASVSQIPTRELPTITSFKFNNKYNYQVVSDAAGIISNDEIIVNVVGIGKRLTATFELSDERARLYADGIEQISKESRLRYDTTRILAAGFPGDKILSLEQTGLCFLKPYIKEYAVQVSFLTDLATEVPRIDINTVGGENISSKDYYLDAQIIIDGKGVFPSMTDSVKVKGRGNTSWSSDPNAKNPYRLKFNSKVKLLGLAKGKNWVLLANKIDGSMLTNAYGMKAASLLGTAAANHIIPVDLYVNGKYKGSYNLTEKVGLSSNNVNIDSDSVATLLEMDTYYDEADGQKFRSSPYALPINIKDPEFGTDYTLLTLSDIQQRFNSFALTLRLGGDIARHVNIDFLARYLLANELLCNRELFHPKSTYCYHENILDENSKFVFGPMWDLDWAMGYNGTSSASYFKNNIRADFYSSNMTQIEFFRTLRNNKTVAKRIYALCRDFINNNLDELCEYCEEYYLYAEPSLDRNKTVWTDATDYAEQAVRASEWFRKRASYIYRCIRLEQVPLGDVNNDGIVDINDVIVLIDYLIIPNRTLLSEIDNDLNDDGQVNITDVTMLIDILLGCR